MRVCTVPAASPYKADPNESPGKARPSAAGADPGLGAGSGRAGEGDPLFFAGARLALKSAAASAKILRLNADEATLRDLRFAAGDPLGPAANLLSHWRDCAVRPPSLDPARIGEAAARLDLALPDPNGLAASLNACAGEGDPVSAAAKAAAAAFSVVPAAPAPPSEILRFGCSTSPSPFGSAGRGPFR